jgi:hypothetical protein
MKPFRSAAEMLDAHELMFGVAGRQCAEVVLKWAATLFAEPLDTLNIRVVLAPIELGPYNKHVGYHHGGHGRGTFILGNRHIAKLENGELTLSARFEDFIVHELTHARQHELMCKHVWKRTRGVHRDRGWYTAISEACPNYLGFALPPALWPTGPRTRAGTLTEVEMTHWPESIRDLKQSDDPRLYNPACDPAWLRDCMKYAAEDAALGPQEGDVMNRHERRAAETQTRNSFKEYDALYRRAFKKVEDRDIGESWMRGAAAEADDIKGMIIHPPNEAPPSRDQCDARLSAAYGPQQFVAHVKSEHGKTLEAQWTKFVNEVRTVPDNPLTSDPRSDARDFIFEMIMTNRPYSDGAMAALTASAIVWLARTSPVAVAVGSSHKSIHYEITDIGTAPDGRKMRITG